VFLEEGGGGGEGGMGKEEKECLIIGYFTE